MGERGIAIRYTEAVESFVELARTLDAEEWATTVPCTPLWTVRDVLSHVAGIPDDGLAGRTDGAATDPWTASQVERNARLEIDELLERWESQYEFFGAAIGDMGEERPPFDCHTHEHDIRHAIGRPGNRDSAIIDDAAVTLTTGLAEAPVALTVRFDDGTSQSAGRGDGSQPVGLDTTKFELFRSRLGRRTPAQVRSLAWSGEPDAVDAVLDAWFAFGPSEITIDE